MRKMENETIGAEPLERMTVLEYIGRKMAERERHEDSETGIREQTE